MTSETKLPTWSEIKRTLAELDQRALLALVGELYKLNNDNKVFLTSRFTEVDPQTLAEPYRKTIREQFNPARGFPKLNLRAARKAVNDFKKSCSDPAAIADLMLYHVEQGVICTQTYGDIDEKFYASVESVYAEAIRVIVESGNPELADHLRSRAQNIVRNTRDMGWGFHDALVEEFESYYPPEDI